MFDKIETRPNAYMRRSRKLLSFGESVSERVSKRHGRRRAKCVNCKVQKSVCKNSHLNSNYGIFPGTTVSQNWQIFVNFLSFNAYISATIIGSWKIPKLAENWENLETFVRLRILGLHLKSQDIHVWKLRMKFFSPLFYMTYYALRPTWNFQRMLWALLMGEPTKFQFKVT